MNVKIAKNSGFCFGVKRAIKIALKTSRDNHEIVTLGPIIHNPQMVEKLEKENIFKIDDIKQIKGRPTIIRSHGIKKEILDELKKNDIEIINATCPYVSKTQDYIKSLSEDGYELIILGDSNHPEVEALRSYVDDEVMIVANADELVEKQFNTRKKPVGNRWRLDETYIKVKGQWRYLYRAVDKNGNTELIVTGRDFNKTLNLFPALPSAFIIL
jgi:4-hydroxy-3-methylbut-2-enyl diphosphate reductase